MKFYQILTTNIETPHNTICKIANWYIEFEQGCKPNLSNAAKIV